MLRGHMCCNNQIPVAVFVPNRDRVCGLTEVWLDSWVRRAEKYRMMKHINVTWWDSSHAPYNEIPLAQNVPQDSEPIISEIAVAPLWGHLVCKLNILPKAMLILGLAAEAPAGKAHPCDCVRMCVHFYAKPEKYVES